MKRWILPVLMLFVCASLNAQEVNKNIHVKFSGGKPSVDPPNYELVSYDISILPYKGEYLGPFSVIVGKPMSAELKKAYEVLNLNDRVFFENVKVRDRVSKLVVQAANEAIKLE